MERVTEERVFEALRQVEDPELHRDIVSLGMVKNLAVNDGQVSFTVELTTPACPLRETIDADCKKALSQIAGINAVQINFGAQVRGSKAGGGQTDLLPTVKNVVLVAAGKGGMGVPYRTRCAYCREPGQNQILPPYPKHSHANGWR